MKYLLVIPTYNCGKQIGRLLENSASAVNDNFDELLIIDNCSSDETIKIVISSIDKIKIKTKVIQNNENISLGGSLKTGFLYASERAFDYVAVMHGDDQADLYDMLPMLKQLEYKKVDLAIGARFHHQSNLIGYSKFRKIGNRLLNLYCIICTRKKIDDLIAGLNVFRVSKLDLKQLLTYPDDLTFDVHVLLRAIHLKQNIEFFPITWTEEDQISNAKVVRQAIVILGLFTKYVFLGGKALTFTESKNTYKDFKVAYEKISRND